MNNCEKMSIIKRWCYGQETLHDYTGNYAGRMCYKYYTSTIYTTVYNNFQDMLDACYNLVSDYIFKTVCELEQERE